MTQNNFKTNKKMQKYCLAFSTCNDWDVPEDLCNIFKCNEPYAPNDDDIFERGLRPFMISNEPINIKVLESDTYNGTTWMFIFETDAEFEIDFDKMRRFYQKYDSLLISFIRIRKGKFELTDIYEYVTYLFPATPKAFSNYINRAFGDNVLWTDFIAQVDVILSYEFYVRRTAKQIKLYKYPLIA